MLACAMLAALAAQGALADATAMCLDMGGTTEAQCACATEALAGIVGEEEAALYDAVGTRYLANLASGQGMGDAWDAAIAETAADNGLGRTALLTRMNDAGKAHRGAIAACQ